MNIIRQELLDKIIENRGKRSIDLSILGITNNDLELILDELIEFEEIDLSGNMINFLSGNFKKLQNLKKLSLANNYLINFPEEICFLEKIEFLDLRENKIFKIFECVENLKNLKYLYLKGNSLKNFPIELLKLEKLEVLGLVKTGISEIPKSIKKLKKLKSLWLGKNKIRVIPKELLELKKLENITLDNNFLPIDSVFLANEKNPKKIYELYLENKKNIKKLKIAVGTTNPAKLKAIEEAIEKTVYFKGSEIEIIPLKVSSGISDMPLSEAENMAGAKNRAKNCKKEIEKQGAKDPCCSYYYVGMEGGTTIIEDKAYLFGVVYILDDSGKGHFGFSNKMEVPEFFRKKIYDEDLELGPVLSEVTSEEDASKKGGAFAHWSDDMLTRKDQFILAFLSGIVPFFNKYYKM